MSRTRGEIGTWTAQAKYRFRTVEAKRYRTPRIVAQREQSFGDLPVSEHPCYDGGIRQIDLNESIDHTLESLTPREEWVVRHVLGLREEAHSFTQLAKDLHRSVTCIQGVYQKALRKLRHPARRKHLKAFLETT